MAEKNLRVLNIQAKIPFVENKKPNMDRITSLLSQCSRTNQWANRGPLYHALMNGYETHVNVSEDLAITPCANGGIGLEAIAKFLEIKFTKPIRWVASSFSFSNLGRGYFYDTMFVDCTSEGMLSLDALSALDDEAYDGIIVTNPFGVWDKFDDYIDFARKSGKYMIIDNAAGLREHLPEWSYQSFSLHHTKPYGAGEGGMILTPKSEAESVYNLLNYVPLSDEEKKKWINNGKVSDIACAFQIDRLEQIDDWMPKYQEQTERITKLATEIGLQPLFSFAKNVPATSLPFISETPILLEKIEQMTSFTAAKYYLPLSKTPNCVDIYSRLINIPSHPDVAELSDEQWKDDMLKSIN
ncbi:MAG: DegT/DnrJ/EryC1/StrS family aminotransferase [Sneathiella sp.]